MALRRMIVGDQPIDISWDMKVTVARVEALQNRALSLVRSSLARLKDIFLSLGDKLCLLHHIDFKLKTIAELCDEL